MLTGTAHSAARASAQRSAQAAAHFILCHLSPITLGSHIPSPFAEGHELHSHASDRKQHCEIIYQSDSLAAVIFPIMLSGSGVCGRAFAGFIVGDGDADPQAVLTEGIGIAVVA
ncbi:hypothetical protein AC579_8267 [Pseudocercospora musae]|uniref:Uncharacterized protein n=1 Tax=Pseudocercospora musae TaxID=113226 RepID=A0A139IVJ6_9PEZI|nr:hypothetical protein AC579_8267 [Pseudocercospora musae]